MIYIDKNPNPSGAYPNPKCQQFPGCIALNEEQAAEFLAYNGFVTVTQDGDTVTVEPNVETWEAWKASLPEPAEPEPTQLDLIEAQVTYTAMMTDTLLEV